MDVAEQATDAELLRGAASDRAAFTAFYADVPIPPGYTEVAPEDDAVVPGC